MLRLNRTFFHGDSPYDRDVKFFSRAAKETIAGCDTLAFAFERDDISYLACPDGSYFLNRTKGHFSRRI